ncbi:transcriptional regulator c-terminal region [Lucifera butyrica]|uniref:Transcriptional regulator c-terminal region n=1 Tax=Lucifera butyrica TaxID=1351585 RepID=A0A498REZ5_9FIRM|nr:TetR-like C-terminal domain-containing protein [Lucifera butyrica]VBB09575.1 transcriptional regulator c-terminal region [Lucifera butyrica]
MADRRKDRSNTYLVQALVRLMENQDIQSITIQNLVDEAEIARSTFYSLYEDKQQFLDKIIEDMFSRLRSETMPEKPSKSGFHEKDRYKYYVKHFLYIAQNANFFRVMLSNHGLSCFRKKMEDSARITYAEIFSDIDETRLPIPKDCLIQYLISAHMGITFKWLEDNMKYSPFYMAEMISLLTCEGILRSLYLDNMVNLPK